MNEIVTFIYTNYKGETSACKVVPYVIRFGKSQWHPEEQWLLLATDLSKGKLQEFAMKDIKDWKPSEETGVEK